MSGATSLRVVLSDRREFDAELVLSDERVDLAVLRIDTGGEAKAAPGSQAPKAEPLVMQAKTTAPSAVAAEDAGASTVAQSIPRIGESGRFYSPLVRNIAKEEGLAIAELERIEGSGKDGRVTKKDILGYLPHREANGADALQSAAAPAQEAVSAAPKAVPAAVATAAPAKKAVTLFIGPDDEVVEMDRMRRIISDHMVHSKYTSPHVTSYVEADMTPIVEWRNRYKHIFEKRDGEKLTFTPIFIEAIVRAIKDMPNVNVSTDGERIVKRKHINIGMATALPSGNLIVPVIHDADQLNLLGLTKRVNDLARRARENKLKPEEIQGGTYTITNVGSFGNVMGTPIINQPQAAIMAVGAIRKKPAVIETPQGDFIGIRHMMFLSHSYDHRIIDGALGGTFVRKVADYLEQFDVNREI